MKYHLCMNDIGHVPLESSVAAQLRMVHRLFVRDLEHCLSEHKINLGMWYFFRALWEEDGLTQRALSDRAGETSAAAVGQLRAMEKRGFIRRESDPKDKRKIRVFLTDEGRRRNELLNYAAEVQSLALEGLTEGEIGFLRLVLARMRESFARRAELQRRHRVKKRNPRRSAGPGEANASNVR
jgi:DNA-binding MarR family transcriptional regulator